MSDADLYLGREQTFVKHFVLKRYLERFAMIVGSKWDSITYVDCFSGPWNVESNSFADSSFSIAIDQLKLARSVQEKKGRHLELRCFFLERNKDAYKTLSEFTAPIRDVEIRTHNDSFENSIDEIVRFIKSNPGTFPFLFIDPTGWSGIAIDTIRPLLKLKPSEFLVNFMTGHIKRFVGSSQVATQESFNALFGSSESRTRVTSLSKDEREDGAVREYCAQLKAAGRFDYTCAAIVLHPTKDAAHFHLLYATRNWKGVEVFKEAERSAMAIMETKRAEAKQRGSQARRGGQKEMFEPAALHGTEYYGNLRNRYMLQARSQVESQLATGGRIAYDSAWDLIPGFPLVWEADLRDWISEWQVAGRLRLEGLKPRERRPKRNQQIKLIWNPD